LKEAKQRLDKELVSRGLADTRQRAHALILAGSVTVDGRRVDKAGTLVPVSADIRLTGLDMPYASRGGLKLKAALDKFGIKAAGLVCADIGSSTGGFTDCLLQEGAARVYAVDVGYGLLHMKLRADPRVVPIERFNVRFLEPATIGEPVDLATVDVSFISLKLVLGPIMKVLKPGGEIVALVKPQFEAGREHVGKGGIVKDEAARARTVQAVKSFAESIGLLVKGEMESPIKGAKGNVEYLLHLKA
jgi:23S rRNA (cytidine1920-2'-O)/16S rRNA (cytidine1409-2'-O)-methyltransferase